jgi:hypothetical protein
MATPWRVIWRLEDDPILEQMKKVAEMDDDIGLSSELGPVGSARWWSNVRSREIEVEGKISAVSDNPDWPWFMIEGDPEAAKWGMEGDASEYQVGRHARVRFMMHPARERGPGVPPEVSVVTEISIRS